MITAHRAQHAQRTVPRTALKIKKLREKIPHKNQKIPGEPPKFKRTTDPETQSGAKHSGCMPCTTCMQTATTTMHSDGADDEM